MTDYASLKVPDLKKLLSERSLPQSGNKADLIARLQENDKSTSLFYPSPSLSLDSGPNYDAPRARTFLTTSCSDERSLPESLLYQARLRM